MLWFEREVVSALVSPTIDHRWRSEIESYVDSSLSSMPDHLRLGVAAESLLFGAWPRLQHASGRHRRDSIQRRIERWKASRFDPIRQYVRLLESLVLFAENELVPEARP